MLAAVFLLAGPTKPLNLDGFRRTCPTLAFYGYAARPVAVPIPAFRLILAPRLIARKLAWYALCAALGLLIIFILAGGFALRRGIATVLAGSTPPRQAAFPLAYGRTRAL